MTAFTTLIDCLSVTCLLQDRFTRQTHKIEIEKYSYPTCHGFDLLISCCDKGCMHDYLWKRHQPNRCQQQPFDRSVTTICMITFGVFIVQCFNTGSFYLSQLHKFMTGPFQTQMYRHIRKDLSHTLHHGQVGYHAPTSHQNPCLIMGLQCLAQQVLHLNLLVPVVLPSLFHIDSSPGKWKVYNQQLFYEHMLDIGWCIDCWL